MHWEEMPSLARRRKSAAALAAALLLAAFAVRCVGRAELHCENAVARLERCCSGFEVDESYCSQGENCWVVYPTISESDASCIVNASCETIVANGICARAMAAPPRTEDSSGDLCP